MPLSKTDILDNIIFFALSFNCYDFLLLKQKKMVKWKVNKLFIENFQMTTYGLIAECVGSQ